MESSNDSIKSNSINGNCNQSIGSSGCPVDHKNLKSGCPVDHKNSGCPINGEQLTQGNSKNSKETVNPLNMMPFLPQHPLPGQKRPLSTARAHSSIPMGDYRPNHQPDNSSNWVYPSEQQYFNAMKVFDYYFYQPVIL